MDETKVNGMLQELQQHVMLLSTRSASVAGELAVANQRIQALTEQNERQTKELEEMKNIKVST